MTQRHWLQITEYIAIATSIGGTFATIITQQVIFSITPLTITLLLNTINRQRQFSYIRQLPEHRQLLETYNDLISVNEDYRFHKLEVEEELKKFEHNQALLKLVLEKLKDTYQDDVYSIDRRIVKLQSNPNKSKIDELNQLYSSFNKRLANIENIISSQQNNSINTKKHGSKSTTYQPSVSSKHRTERVYSQNHHTQKKVIKNESDNSDRVLNPKGFKEIDQAFKDL